ncbi:thioredoxin domain-containing protein [Trichonephila clavata]|uniref:Thioredoxin domain-containing protein n=1 Tax=Trichonephila clavata TaxID=2740835 RepID=A0A8X6F6P2_TRICU|nr:thioredoxin domain-containing protein [Trichonephila clavata]
MQTLISHSCADKEDNEESDKVIQKLENIDDEADAKNIGFVKIADENLAIEYGLDTLPALIYYRKKIPLLFDGDLLNEEEVLNYLFEFQDLGEESEAIEDVSANSLIQLIEESRFLAVLFYDIESRRSQRILEQLEDIDDDALRHGIPFVKIEDRKLASEYGIETLPTLVYFENKMPNFYQGDLTKEEDVLDWLVKQANSDEIEDVTDRVLQHMIKRTHELVVLFYDKDDQSNQEVMQNLENIDDDADKLGIPFVKIDDTELAQDYGIENLPTLIFFENQVPNFYKGNLTTEEAVLNWLKELQSSDEIEAVSDKVIELMINKCDYLAVIFYNADDAAARKAINELENIDSESDKAGIPLVRSESLVIAEMYGIDDLPALVFFENGVPNVYPDDLSVEQDVLKWLLDQQSSDEIEDVSPKVLEQMISKTEHLAVLFYDKNDRKSKEVLRELENIDDEAAEHDMPFVRIDDKELAAEYGFDDIPMLVYFEKRIPSIYQGDLTNEQQVWKWLHLQLTSDGIEEVTEKILYMLIGHNDFVAVLFYDHKSKKSAKVLKELETIDDDADQYNILIVKNDNFAAAQKYGLKKLPALLFFKEGSPIVYEGNLMKEEEVLDWLIGMLANDEIEDVNENTLDHLIENSPSVAVFFYDKDAEISEKVLHELEHIDDDTDRYAIPFVRIDDDSVAKEFGILDELPILVYFENKIPSIYEGDLMKEEEVLAWIIKQKEEDTIEEVTDEILEEMIKEYEYVLVFFAPNDCKECEKILHELENIDDETDDNGIIFVTTDDMTFAKKEAKLSKFPAVVLFRNGVPVVYKGDLKDEDALLKWVTSEEALDIPDKIEEVNKRMLDKLLETSPYVAVLFYQEENPLCDKILNELENIDDDAEEYDIDFVKISDPKLAEEYTIVSFPTLVFFRKHFPQFYDGDLMDEESVLKWLVESKQMKDDVIEYVDKKMLDVLLDDVDHIAVYFYEKGCTECDTIIQHLEKVDESTDRHGIHFVKTDDVEMAEELGVMDFPSLVYYEHEIPSIYPGHLLKEKEVLSWLLMQKNEDTIENVNREMFFKLLEDQEFLAVLFYAENDKESEEVAHHLEKIDDDCSEFDVHLVKMSDKVMAKKHGIKNPPGLVFFRNGKPIKYPGKMMDEEEVLEWLTSPENMAVSDVIEKVNKKMFDKILQRFDYVAVYFYAEAGCKLCGKVIEELEKIDDEAEAESIHIVKVDDSSFSKKYGVFAFPAMLFFRGPESEPIIYAGDMKNGERMLDWLLTQKDPDADVIEEIEGEELRHTIETAEHLAVFFYDKNLCSNCDNENIDTMECEDCMVIMEELQNIADDTDRNGIQFVKTTDLDVLKKYGIKITPALVYYENQVPSIYEGLYKWYRFFWSWLISILIVNYFRYCM